MKLSEKLAGFFPCDCRSAHIRVSEQNRNNEYTPAFWHADELHHDLADLIRTHPGETPRYIREGNGMIAMWGNVQVRPVDPTARSLIAADRSPHVGILLATVGDLKTAIATNLPIYHVISGEGLVWCANDTPGRGYLRFFAINADALSNDAPVADGTIEHEPNAFAPIPSQTFPPTPVKPSLVDHPNAPLAVPDETHRHLQEWLRNARDKGPVYAKESGTTWKLNRKIDVMTDLYDTTVESDQVGGRDDLVQAHVVGQGMNRGHVRWTALITDRNGRASISIARRQGTFAPQRRSCN